MSLHASARRGLIGSIVAGLVVTPLAVGLTVAPARANVAGTNLVISEVYGGGGSTSSAASYKQDFVELYNPTDAPISLSGWSIQYRSATGSAANAVALPNKVVPANDRFLIAMGAVSTGGADLPAADATASTLNLAAASGLVVLSNGTAALTVPTGNIPAGTTGVVDAVGYGATVTSFETARMATVGTTTLAYVRNPAGADTDNNSLDLTTTTPTPQAATGSTTPTAPPLAATNPGDKTGVVGTAITGFTLAATGGTAPYTWTATGLPAGVTVAANGAVSGTPTASGTFTVTATATDSATPTAATGTTSFTLTVAPAPLSATDPGDKTATTGTAITGFSLAATGGTTPYSWTATGLPAGVTVSTAGDVSGTPTTTGTYDVTATVTDAATPTAATATTSFTITVGQSTAPVDVQVLATNDFHGRIQNDTGTGSAGAAVLAGAVKQLRAANPNTTFAAAGDLIGASTFESFIQHDKPTIDALNEAGLEVSAVGNHEFDQGYDDLVNRVMKPYDADTNPYGGASWKYLGANVKFKASGDPALDGTWMKTQGGVQVGYIGAVTEHLPELVSPGGISDIQVTDIATAANTAANQLKADGADVIVLLVHEGAAGTDCTTINSDTTSDFGKITSAVNDNVDAIVSGHTHLTYNCAQPVAGWSDRPVTTRPIVSAGQYGTNLNQLVFTVDPTTGVVQAKTQAVLPLKNGVTGSTFNYPVDANTQTIVTTAVNNANVLGAQPLGNIAGPSYRAKLADGTTENRGGESTLGNLVAEIQRDQTSGANRGGAQIAFMNPGGLRADLVGQGTGAFPRVATYKDAANVQPFANTLVNEALTGAQIKAALEQQWQPSGASRPFLKLGISKGFTYTYDPNGAQGSRVKAMYLDGTAVDLTATYSVTVNSFLSTGGDNFTALNGTGRKQDTGVTDLQAQVDYFAAQASGSAGLPVDSTQRGVGAVVTTATPTAGQDVALNLTSLSMTGPGAVKDTSVEVKLDGVTLGSFPVTSTLQTQLPGYDEVGTATVVVTLPVSASGAKTLVVSGPTTGTVARVPITVAAAPTVDVQVLATNDFHGRIQNDTTTGSSGAAVLAGAVKQLRAANPNTTFAAAGDLIGASTFESFIAKDKPTIDALNEAGLEVSAVGNHEFDQGYDDLVNRVMKPYDADTNPYGGASWKYLGANVKFKDSNDPALDGTWMKTMDGVQVGYIGAVTEHLPELVSPGGISDIKVTDIAAAANAAADDLKAAGADVVVLLVHEGASGTDCATINSDTTSDFGKITSAVDGDIDAIVSGHTHLVYNCSQPVSSWANRPVTTRPIVSAGQYGTNLNQLVFTVDPSTGVVQAKTQAVLALKSGTTGSTFNYPVDANTQTIVDNAVANANVLGAQPLGRIAGTFNRAKLADGTTENRGGESTLGNLVAEIQRDQTSDPAFGAAQIAFMNPGGLRADLAGTAGDSPRTVTYKQAATVQPFANTLVNEDLTGAQIKAALEQQWQPTGSSRPFLKLGISKGFRYTYDPTAAQGERIRTMTLNGTPIVLTDTYSVTVNSFLSTGGDNFAALNGKGRKQDTGRTDLQAQVDYFAANAAGSDVLAVDYSQRGVGVTVPAGAPATYPSGASFTADLTSLSMTGPGDVLDTTVTASIDGGDTIATFPVTTAPQTQLPGYDEVGTASVGFNLPSALSGGTHDLVLTGNRTGTVVKVPFAVEATPSVATTVTGTADPVGFGEAATVHVTVTPDTGTADPAGTVTLLDGATEIGTVTLADGEGDITVPASALDPGDNPFTLSYAGADGFSDSTGSVTVTVEALDTTVTGTAASVELGEGASVHVVVDAADSALVPTGTVRLLDGTTEVGTVTLVDGEGDITVPASALEVGDNSFTLSYLGADGFAASTGTVSVTVTRIAAEVSGTTTSVTYGSAASIPVRVGPTTHGTPTGTVTVKDGATTVATATLGANGTGAATIEALALPAGTYTLSLSYAGDDLFTAATGTVTLTVAKGASTTDATARETTVVVKKNSTRFTVTVGAPGYTPTGTVRVVINGSQTVSGTLVDGVASIVVGPWTSVGASNAAVSYLGDANTEPSTDTVRITVTKQTPTLKVTAPTSVRKGTKPTVKVALTGSGGTVSGQVRFNYNGKFAVQTLVGGKTTRTLPGLSKTTKVTVTFLANATYTGAVKAVTIKVVP
ncbi:5'-nucleotidase C-terminal domain-containing protein [Nocardioides plantarum]|uniref:5'-nucleotidase C-terminal domain-containing protein n=1 Tax=Nocardioides plantarum TaxID=29299 RepID=A0ABV5KE97_9ACTN|nr:5'-nucleotidase C-terminal domain-containing protein [Nocardioides plantarum]